MYKTALILTLAVGLAGCAAPPPRVDWVPHTGSRADATITLAYTYDIAAGKPLTSDQQALESAQRRCAVWGYPDAEPFGGVEELCVDRNKSGACLKMSVKKIYQCLGRGDSATPENRVKVEVY